MAEDPEQPPSSEPEQQSSDPEKPPSSDPERPSDDPEESSTDTEQPPNDSEQPPNDSEQPPNDSEQPPSDPEHSPDATSSEESALRLLLCYFCCSIGLAILIRLALLAIPVAMIAVGSYYIDDCPVEDRIPLYLIVKGVSTFLNLLNNLWKLKWENDGQTPPLFLRLVEALLGLFIFAWFIAGNVWVYGNYFPINEVACNTHLYLFAFWMITLTHIFAGICVVAVCVKMLCC